ncbi:MAG: hypothetical protein CMJ52_02435 [Planctomycetaceae bacterium]|nr:hypothetical protein [Planctomycetaceae bacterium]
MTHSVLAAGQGRAIRIRNGNVVFKTVGADNGGRVGIFEQTMQRGDPGPVPHFHRETTEMFFLIEGSLEFFLDDAVLIIEAGGFVRVPPNTIHHFSQRGDVPARFLIMFTPGKAREKYFEGLAAIASEDGPPDRNRLVALMHEYDQFLADEDAYLAGNY